MHQDRPVAVEEEAGVAVAGPDEIDLLLRPPQPEGEGELGVERSLEFQMEIDSRSPPV